MKITLNKSHYRLDLIIKDGNTTITDDIEIHEYFKKDGKPDFTSPPNRDIKTDVLDQFVFALNEMIQYRNTDYNSSELVESLFNKLPKEVCNDLIVRLNHDFGNDVKCAL